MLDTGPEKVDWKMFKQNELDSG